MVLRRCPIADPNPSSIVLESASSQNQVMERQFASQAELEQPVTVTPLQSGDAIFKARFIDLSAEGVQIKLDSDLEVGSLLRLEFGDDLMITEVSRCEPDQGEFTAGLLILSWLGKTELKRLRREAVVGPTVLA